MPVGLPVAAAQVFLCSVNNKGGLRYPKIMPAGQSSLAGFGKRQRAWPVAADDFDIGTCQAAVSFSQERQLSSEPITGPANADPDATAARSASRIDLIFIVVSQDGLDTS
jgi:hypothetical protein